MITDGRPTLLSGPAPATDLQLASAATDMRLQAAARPVWGIFGSNQPPINPLIEADSIVALDYHREWAVADFPLEQGGFSSYDKVTKPFDVRLRMAKAGNDTDRAAFLAAVESLGASLTLVDIVTPNRTYIGVTIASIGYHQSASNGVGMITVDIGLREIRETAASGFTARKVKHPGSADPAGGGMVQPQPASPAVQAAVKAALARQAPLEVIARRALAPASAAGTASR